MSINAVDRPASLMFIRTFEIDLHSERKFMLADVSVHTAGITLPSRTGTFGASYELISHPVYKNSVSVISYGMGVSERLRTGVMFEFYQTSVSGYMKRSTVAGGIGVMIQLQPQMHAGIQIKNIHGKAIRHGAMPPLIYQVGIGYDVGENVFTGIEVKMQSHQSAFADITVLYAPHPKITMLGGIELEPATPKFGILIPLKSVAVCVQSSFHPQLGLSPGILIIYKKASRKE